MAIHPEKGAMVQWILGMIDRTDKNIFKESAWKSFGELSNVTDYRSGD